MRSARRFPSPSTICRFCAPSVLLLSSALACGGRGRAAGDATEPHHLDTTPTDAAMGESDSEQPELEQPTCNDTSCFDCGEGICPEGAYCDLDARGGPACAWLSECSKTPSCDCVTGVLGSGCECDDEGGGPVLHCSEN